MKPFAGRAATAIGACIARQPQIFGAWLADQERSAAAEIRSARNFGLALLPSTKYGYTNYGSWKLHHAATFTSHVDLKAIVVFSCVQPASLYIWLFTLLHIRHYRIGYSIVTYSPWHVNKRVYIDWHYASDSAIELEAHIPLYIILFELSVFVTEYKRHLIWFWGESIVHHTAEVPMSAKFFNSSLFHPRRSIQSHRRRDLWTSKCINQQYRPIEQLGHRASMGLLSLFWQRHKYSERHYSETVGLVQSRSGLSMVGGVIRFMPTSLGI